MLVELTGQLDFETALESSLRNPAVQPPLPTGGALELKPSSAAVAGANPNPKDGVVDFRLTVVHDPATHAWTETLAIGAHPDDINGLLQLTNQRGASVTPSNRLKDMLGSVLILAPIIGSTAAALDPNTADGYVVLGGTVVGAAALGAAGFIKTEKITLYGGELRLRQYIPPGDPAQFTDAGIVFDYGVAFGVDISELGIESSRALKVRYRALGFNLNFPSAQYQPIFDTSKGYELDLSDPGLFKLPSPIDNVLKILGARIAKVNPLTVELDLGMKVDLGVVTVDRFKVKLPVEPPGVPTILPSGVKLDIAKVLLGSGYVNIIDPPSAPPGQSDPGFGGFEGSFDVTLIPLKLRIAARLGIRPVSRDGRNATAVFLGLVIDLPTPIPLGQSGIGIYGFSGLFAMHFKRIESDPDPNDAVGPAMLWLRAADGDPTQLINKGVRLWDAELDRWSFGVGISLGTIEGGFLFNLRGMFVLELPGPRILVFVKILIIQPLPDLKPGADLTVGILGVIDLDFARRSFTIGVIVDLAIEEIISVVVPVELFTKLDDLTNWHLFVGTFSAPSSALVLNIVRGFGYVMIAGHDIAGWPGYGTTRTLPGIAMAAGIGASIVLGDESIGLYLKVSARADAGVSFSPRLFLVGRIQLEGELRLFIVSVGATGRLDVEGPDPTRISGEVCGHVDFFFFSVEGCVGVEIGPSPTPPPPPQLIRNVWLQSHAPVITAGQGGDRPIDASLGDALPLTDTTGRTPPVVPIDTVPVIQFQTAPTVTTATTFTQELKTPPGLRTGGWVPLGGSRRVTYALTALRLTGGPAPAPGLPPATWRPDPAVRPESGRTNIDLALMSNVPLMGARAMERSADLDAVIDGTWGTVCTPVAPPSPVLWTFCGQPLGPSGHGWTLTGHAWPDPPGMTRATSVDVTLRIEEPDRAEAVLLLDGLLGHTAAGRIEPARVIGPNGPSGEGDPGRPDEPLCVLLTDQVRDGDPNPTSTAAPFRLTVSDANGIPVPALRLSGVGQNRGLDTGRRTELQLAQAVTEVTLTMVTFAQPATAAAFDAAGRLIDRTRMSGQQRTPEALRLAGTGIVRVVVDSPQDETVLVQVCSRTDAGTGPPPPPTGPGSRSECMRALQLPEQIVPGGKGDIELTPELRKLAHSRPDERWVDLVTGSLKSARLYLAVSKTFLGTDAVTVEQLDDTGTVRRSDPLGALSPVLVGGTTGGLPGRWTDPTGPWQAEVAPVAELLDAPDFAGLVRLWVTVEPDAATVRLRLRVRGSARAPEHPAVVLAVVEILSGDEISRAATEEAVRDGRIDTLAGYLNGTSKVPLLAPGQTYDLEIAYRPTTQDGEATPIAHPPQTETFRFRTDSAPPERLDPYVLATSPRHEERFVLADEAVNIVFNDLQVVQLYAAYDRQLRAVLRAADGTSAPEHQVLALTEIPAVHTSPLMDSLDAEAKAGRYPCLGPYHLEGHGRFPLPEPLRPSMAYTLDIEAVPTPQPPAGKPVVPLFRRQFSTSRFTSLTALVDEMKARPLQHAALTGPLSGLPSGGQTALVADIEIEEALTGAGLAVPGAPARGDRTVLWRPVTEGRHVPHALLLDASEPLWRFRDAPREEAVPVPPGSSAPADPSFKRIVPGQEPSLELQSVGAAPSRASYARPREPGRSSSWTTPPGRRPARPSPSTRSGPPVRSTKLPNNVSTSRPSHSRATRPGRTTMPRIVNPDHFVLQLASLDDAFAAGRVKQVEAKLGPLLRRRKFDTREPGVPVSLRWVLSPHLGFPRVPFEVWRRVRKEQPTVAVLGTGAAPQAPNTVTLSTEVIEIRFDAQPVPGRSLTVEALALNGHTLPGQRLTFTSDQPGRFRGAGIARLKLRGAGRILNVAGLPQTDWANLPDWVRIEVVGFPFEPGTLPASSYDTSASQGWEAASLQGPEAARIRLTMAQLLQLDPPPVGAGGLMPPPWPFPDPGTFADVLRKGPGTDIADCLLTSDDTDPLRLQGGHAITRPMPGIRQPGQPAGSDPAHLTLTTTRYIALATQDSPVAVGLGFGTADIPQAGPLFTSLKDVLPPGTLLGREEYMVTAPFVLPGGVRVELAALGHRVTPPPHRPGSPRPRRSPTVRHCATATSRSPYACRGRRPFSASGPDCCPAVRRPGRTCSTRSGPLRRAASSPT